MASGMPLRVEVGANAIVIAQGAGARHPLTGD